MGDRDHSIECEHCGVWHGGFNDRDAEHVCEFDYAQIIAAYGCDCACETMSIPPWCATCEARRLLHRLANLAANLRTGAALELARNLGVNYERYQESFRRKNAASLHWDWHPGARKAAAGWGGE